MGLIRGISNTQGPNCLSLHSSTYSTQIAFFATLALKVRDAFNFLTFRTHLISLCLLSQAKPHSQTGVCQMAVCVSPPVAFASAVPLSSDLGCCSRTVVILKLLQTSAFHEYRLISLKIHKLTIYLSLLNEYSYEPLLLPMTRALMQIHSAAAAQLPALIPLISKEQTCPCIHDLNSQSLPLTLIHLIMLAAGALVEVCVDACRR